MNNITIHTIPTNHSGLYVSSLDSNVNFSVSFDKDKEEYHVLWEDKNNNNQCEFTTFSKETMIELSYFILSTKFKTDPDEVEFEEE